MTKYVYDFTEGGRAMAELLGGKGANLAEMTKMGLPVPPGFTVTTEACRAFLTTGAEPESLQAEVAAALAELERKMGRTLGQVDDPLLVSVRSGAKFSMPGMMETILDIGLNDESVLGLAKVSGKDRFAWDSYRRLMQMFGKTVMGVDGDLFENALNELKKSRGATSDIDLSADDFKELVGAYKGIVRAETGEDFPQEPVEQMRRAINAVFKSWNVERARIYRRREGIPDDLGTAVNVMTMVFGNLGPDSGTGVAFTRDPATGHTGIYGDYLQNAQGEDVVAGIRNTVPLAELEKLDAASYRQLLEIMQTLENHYRDLCDIEFTIERGKLWMLQTRVGKRTAEAAYAIASELIDEGMINAPQALGRVSGEGLVRMMFPHFDAAAGGEVLAKGIPASPGAAVGAVVFTSAEAVRRAAAGDDVILVRQETNPDDLPGMVAAQAILTSRGGKTSHAAVVARGMGKVCVCGAEALHVEPEARQFTAPGGVVVTEGSVVSVDGSSGAVYVGAVPTIASPVMQYFETGDKTVGGADQPIVAAVARMMEQADDLRKLGVRANADTPDDARRARQFGAEGIGLCRTEHMFLGERRLVVERMILATTDAEREAALAELLPLQRTDFVEILEAMDGLPVTIRLLDPPLHEFLPDRTELAVRIAEAKAAGQTPDEHDVVLLKAVQRMHEQNPMLGLRGCRLGLVIPGLTAMQVRAVAEATVERRRAGGDPRPEIMVPLVGAVQELRLVREEVEQVLAEVSEASGMTVDVPIGTMIELPRAALTADEIAEVAEFFSFGTNDLTQTAWGFSRDDVEAAFFSEYLEKGIFKVSPFETLDTSGVGSLVRTGVEKGRSTRPELKVGVCGEHGGDPASIHFFHGAGLDYVSCSPFRVPVARLEAGRAALESVLDSDSR